MKIPEPSQIVSVRQRRYIVNEVIKSIVSSGDLSIGSKEQHLLKLSSVEDDALGEELQIVWEIEPGTQVYEKLDFPDPAQGTDDPNQLDTFINAIRWGVSVQADYRLIQAPFRSGVAIEDYQLEPLVRAVQMPRSNLLIADDVGIGKTIEAGLIIQEFINRYRARTALIVCPSSLQYQWQREMREKFGLEFRIIDSELLKDLRRKRGIHVNPWTHFPRLITSIDFIKRENMLRSLREVLPANTLSAVRKFDILVLDEAHNIAPAGRGSFYAQDSQRTMAIRTIAPHFENKLFLSATPHNGYKNSFSALLEMLDPQRFARGVEPNRDHLNTVMIRRLKTEITESSSGKKKFPKRKIEPIYVEYSPEEKEIHGLLNKYAELRRQNAKDNEEKYASEFVLKLLKKRLFSSPKAFELTLEKHEHSIQEAKKRKKTTAPRSLLKKEIEKYSQELFSEDAYEETTLEGLSSASMLFSELKQNEQEILAKMKSWANRASAQADCKTKKLIEWLTTNIKPGGQWSDERVIIFTEYKDTLDWLIELLVSKKLYDNQHVLTMYGGMKPEEREIVKNAFQASPTESAVRILLATDSASEGIDLQNHCHQLIHMEVPWNPNRMEQRNGRIDRYGQKMDEVKILHFAPTTSNSDLENDIEFLFRAANKVDTIRQDLGKVGPIIATQVEEAMSGYRKTLDTEQAEKASEKVRSIYKLERDLKKQIQAAYEQLQETKKQLLISPEHIHEIVQLGLTLANQPALIPEKLRGIDVYKLPQLKGSWSACIEGLEHPHTKHIRPVTFDQNVAAGKDDVVLIHLNHRLVQMCLNLLRAEIWSEGSNKKIHRVTAKKVNRDIMSNPAIIGFARLIILGGDSQKLHEDIIWAGGEIKDGKFSRLNIGDMDKIIASAKNEPVDKKIMDSLIEKWQDNKKSLSTALEARAKDKQESLLKDLDQRMEKEVTAVKKILNDLTESIKHFLKEPEYEQLELIKEEKDQYDKDKKALSSRLAEIPMEIESEEKIIRQRYKDPQVRIFPVAITYYLPGNE